MSVAMPKIRVGEPIRHEALSVFPLFSQVNGIARYRLAAAALADESVLVEEVDASGSVPDLLVENKGDVRVLFLEGEELIGAKQNRILNTSVLVAAHSKVKIPVSCVEQGRWRYKSRYFGSSGSHAPTKLRRALKASVTSSVVGKHGHRSDQRAVWTEVDCLQATHCVDSGTAAMSDVYSAYESKLAAYRENLNYVDGATGAAISIGDRIVAVELFDNASTCRDVWERVLSAAVFEALEAGEAKPQATVADVEQFVAAAGGLDWAPAEAIGEGAEYRAESQRGDHASILALEGVVVHGSVAAAV